MTDTEKTIKPTELTQRLSYFKGNSSLKSNELLYLFLLTNPSLATAFKEYHPQLKGLKKSDPLFFLEQVITLFNRVHVDKTTGVSIPESLNKISERIPDPEESYNPAKEFIKNLAIALGTMRKELKEDDEEAAEEHTQN